MTEPAHSSDPEVAAIAALATVLDPLPEEARLRTLAWARSRYGTLAGSSTSSVTRVIEAGPRRLAIDAFPTLGELMGACGPDSHDRRVLLAAAFISHGSKDGLFTGAQVNGALKHLGHRVENITRVLDALIAQRPAMVVPIRKQGSSRQARKVYKVTDAGQQEVQRLIAGSP